MASTPTDVRDEGLPESAFGVSGGPIRQSSLWKDAWRRFRRNRRRTVAGVVFVPSSSTA